MFKAHIYQITVFSAAGERLGMYTRTGKKALEQFKRDAPAGSRLDILDLTQQERKQHNESHHQKS